MRKTGLGKDPFAWIKPTIEKEEKEEEVQVEKRKKIPKYQTFEVRLTVLLKDSHLEFLEKLVREIQKNRSREYKKERITKNTIIRCLIEAFSRTEINLKNIPDEETLLARVLEKIKD